MGICFSRNPEPLIQDETKKPQVESVDIIKAKLKSVRDKVKVFINMKTKDLEQIQSKIKERLPEYEETGDMKKIMPYLRAKKQINGLIDDADVRLKMLNDKISDVEMQQMNVRTIEALEDSNKFINKIQNDLQSRDWQTTLAEAQKKVRIEFPEEQNVEDDPQFQKMWKQLGGDKLFSKKSKQVTKPNVALEIPEAPRQQERGAMMLS